MLLSAGNYSRDELTARTSRNNRAQKDYGYLMNPAHPDNGGKAAFFASLGFSESAGQTLASALLAIASSFPVSKSMESTHGIKYIVDGVIQGPNGLSGIIRTIWIVDSGRDRPRLVTAYPQKGSL